MSKLIRWNTPFAETQFPSASLLTGFQANERDILQAIVAPNGIDKYPKYLISFGDVLAFTCLEEGESPRKFQSIETEETDLCTYEYIDSPWLESYETRKYFWGKGIVSFSHYLIFGGDNNIEVITPNTPTIEVIKNKQTLKLEYEI